MEEYIIPALSIIGVIVAFFLAVKFLVFLFSSYLISRIISLGMGVTCIVVGWPLMMAGFAEEVAENGLILILVLYGAFVLQWMFFMGPAVFDEEWDGTWSVSEGLFGSFDVTPNMSGGIIGHLIGALVAAVVCFGIIGTGFPAMLVALPILLMLITVIGFLKNLFD